MTFEAGTGPTHRRRGLPDRALRSARLRASGLLLAATLWAGATAALGQGAEAPRGAAGPEPAAHVHGHASGLSVRSGATYTCVVHAMGASGTSAPSNEATIAVP